jgi:hypothetical protein
MGPSERRGSVMAQYDDDGVIERTPLSTLAGKTIASVEEASGHALFKDAAGRTMFEVDLGHLFDHDGNYFRDDTP